MPSPVGLRLAAHLGMLSEGLAPPGFDGTMGRLVHQSAAQSLEERERQKAARRARRESRGAALGQVGSMLGGIVAAPFTGGMSLPAAMATTAGASAVGGAAGQLAGSGRLTSGQVLAHGAQGAMTGAGTHMARGMQQQAAAPQEPAVPPTMTRAEPSPMFPQTGHQFRRASGVEGMGGMMFRQPPPAFQAATTEASPGRFTQGMTDFMQGQALIRGMGLTPDLLSPQQRSEVNMQYDPISGQWRAQHAYPL